MLKIDWLKALIAAGEKLPAIWAWILAGLALFGLTPAPAAAATFGAAPPDPLEQDVCDVYAAHAPVASAGSGAPGGPVGAFGFLNFLSQIRQVWELLEANPTVKKIVEAALKALGIL